MTFDISVAASSTAMKIITRGTSHVAHLPAEEAKLLGVEAKRIALYSPRPYISKSALEQALRRCAASKRGVLILGCYEGKAGEGKETCWLGAVCAE